MPKVFISSTILDFRDLRSSIKYYLEELGYDVLLSEFNDFPKPLDQNVFDACLTTLEKVDYYILLIGSRVGGLYDAINKISITRMEYRKAYEMTKLGKNKLIIFVRDDLWKIRHDRNALRSFLQNEKNGINEINAKDIEKIINHPSGIVNDAESIFGFIDEVSKENEMMLAAAGEIPYPSANWIHSFSSFHDIVDVLKTNLGLFDSLSVIALKRNLLRELHENLSLLSSK